MKMNKLEKFLEKHGSNEIDDCVICKYAFGKRDCINIKCPTYKKLFEELNKEYKQPIQFSEDEKTILRNRSDNKAIKLLAHDSVMCMIKRLLELLEEYMRKHKDEI